MSKEGMGVIEWVDLTVPNAGEIRDFYCKVIGWTAVPEVVDDYNDYSMIPPGSDEAITGICHAQGENADQPPVWMVYISVEDLDASLASCRELGGSVIIGPKPLGEDRYAVIKDPAGAILALYESKS